ncbi:MAG: DNA polymerase I [Methylotetracoccus sp.]|nr:DNA polymerase I [Methylotetracoccus sp.]
MATLSTPLLVLIDGSSFLYRAYNALPPLSNSKGTPTGAVYGVANMLRKLLNQYDTPYITVVFDAPGRTFRDDLFEHYKAQRPPMPDDLRAQCAPLHDLIRAMGLPLLMIDGIEADDVIGTLTRMAVQQGCSVVISTGDKDMAQIVNDRVILENTMFDTRIDVDGVKQKFGVPPERIVDYLALIGDTSDNIPGIPKVGPKTAAKWLSEYGTLDNLLAHADEVGGKVGENLRSFRDQIPLSRQLATIRCDVPLAMTLDDLRRREVQTDKLRELLFELEFSSWLRQLDESPDQPPQKSAQASHQSGDYEAVLTKPAFERWMAQLENAELFAFDTETTSLNYIDAEIVGLSFAIEPGKAAYVPLIHDYAGAPPQLSRDWVLQRMKPLLEDAGCPKLGQHLKYDANVLVNHGIALRGIAHDTMLESYVLNSTVTRHDMDSLAERYLHRQTLHYEDVAGKGVKQIPFTQVTVENATAYAAEDADVTLALHHALWPKLQAEPRLGAVYQEIEIPLIPVLSRIERTGVLVDIALLARQSVELAGRMQQLEAAAHAAAGERFNLGSPKQIQTITPTGQPSTDESVLQELAETYDLPRLILEHRSMSKLKSTYTDKLASQVNAKTGRVHTSYHQAVAATGRLSSSDPNLQNIPVRTAEGRRIRQAFIAPAGYRILAADYSQIELRIMAHLSGDQNLSRAFAEEADVHRATAAEVFGLTLDQVTAEQRRSAKAINFGLIYGMSAFGLAKQLNIPQQEAQLYIDLYFARYPGVRKYMDRTREAARSLGYVETLFGRRLHVEDIHSRNAQRRQYAERTAINAPMQGSAADIIKRAMIDVDTWIQSSGLPIRMIMQVHDELVFEVSEDDVEAVREEIRIRMNRAADLSVPLVVDIGVGDNWDEAH